MSYTLKLIATSRMLADDLDVRGNSPVASTIRFLAAEVDRLLEVEADAARVIYDLRQESAAYNQGRADALGEVVRELTALWADSGGLAHNPAAGPFGVALRHLRALGQAAPPRPPDVVRAENETLRRLLRDCVSAFAALPGQALPAEDWGPALAAYQAARKYLGDTP